MTFNMEVNNSTRRVRSNWLRYSWNRISGANKVLLILSFSLSLLQIITTSIVLGIGGSVRMTCEKPLQLYLIVFVIRVGLSIPFTIYQHLSIPRRTTPSTTNTIPNHTNTNNTDNNINNTDDITNNNINNNIPTIITSNNSDENNELNNLTDSINSTSNENGSTRLNTIGEIVEQDQNSFIYLNFWTDRIKSILDLFAILWFIVGNYLIFSPSDCSLNASTYFYTIMTWVLFGYLILLVPAVLFISVIFCLPCVLGTIVMTMRTLNLNNSNEGASKEEIAKIPIFKFQSTTKIMKQSNTTKIKRFRILNKWFFHRLKQSNQLKNSYEDLIISSSEDAICSICLCQYENEDLICKLWCNHHYHKDCVYEWLALNSACPLCKRDFRGKGFNTSNNTEQSDEEQY